MPRYYFITIIILRKLLKMYVANINIILKNIYYLYILKILTCSKITRQLIILYFHNYYILIILPFRVYAYVSNEKSVRLR